MKIETNVHFLCYIHSYASLYSHINLLILVGIFTVTQNNVDHNANAILRKIQIAKSALYLKIL